MHCVTVGLAIFLLLGSELCIVASSTSQSRAFRLARHAHEIRLRRQASASNQSSQDSFSNQSSQVPTSDQPSQTPASDQPSQFPDSDQPSQFPDSDQPSQFPDLEQTSRRPSANCTYRIAMLDFPPYVMNTTNYVERGFMYDKISWFINTACFKLQPEDEEEGKEPPCKMEPMFVRNSKEMIQLIKDKRVDFAFPILSKGKTALRDVKNVTVIRAFVSQGCSLIVNTKQCEKESRAQLLTSITSQWPILACIILLSGISGVVIWLLEHRTNKEEFSSSFTTGSPEGFWWAVVSLTTVGYGDKTPKTFLGRAFGITWILVGAIMLSLFTALFTNAMQAALDGTKCKDIDHKEVGVSIKNTETQMVAKEFEAKIVKFNNLEEMQKNLSSVAIGRVLVDRNTAFHFLDKSGLKKNRQIRLIRNIDYPMDYFIASVSKYGQPPEITDCPSVLRDLSRDLIAVAKQSAKETLIPAELQTASLQDDSEGLFSTGSEMTQFILYCLLGIFLALIFLGIVWELFNKSTAMVLKSRRGRGSPSFRDASEKGNLIPLKNKMSMMQNFIQMEERLKDLTEELQKMKEEFASTIANGDALKLHRQKWLDENDTAEDNRSFFDIFKNGKSKNTATVL